MKFPFRLVPLLAASAVLAPAVQATDVLTWHNDVARTGQNLNEAILTPGNVNSSQFGKLFVIPTDGQIYAQPLIVSGLTINGSVRNVVYIASEHDTVYACDADTGAVLWQKSMLKAGESPSDGRNCSQVTPEIGITATPVIDRNAGPNGTIYVVAMSKNNNPTYFQRLHALDLATGAEQFGGPVDVSASFPGTGDNSNNGNVIFDPKQYKEKAALVIKDGIVYTAWASHCDIRPYTGWVIGYDQNTLARVHVLNLTPNATHGAIWSTGSGPAVDPAGNIYALTGDGTFDTTLNANGFPNRGDYGNCIVKLSTTNNSLQIADYWTMFNTVAESNADTDLGSGGVLVLPDMTDANQNVRHLVVGGGKDGHLYIANRDNMGKFNPSSNGNLYQDVAGATSGGMWSSPAYFNGFLYVGGTSDKLKAFPFSNARLATSPSSQSAVTFSYPGTTPSISANGSSNAILWANHTNSTVPAVLRAYSANNLASELYNSEQAPNNRDHFGTGIKGAVPTVANGKVYVGTREGVGVFGLLASATPTPTPSATPTPAPSTVATPRFSPSGGSFRKKVKVTITDSTSGAAIYYTTNGADPTTSSRRYSGPFKITGRGGHTVKAKAVKSGSADSAVATANYTIR